MKTRFAMTAAALSMLLLGACGKQEQVREIDWAKAALARNPAFEIVATDENAGVAGEEAAPTTEVLAAEGAASGPTLVEGPGYSITRAGVPADSPPANLEGPGYSITRETPAAARQEQQDTAPRLEVRTDPIVCQGDRLMRIDGETIEFAGDAVIAENGCDLYISNARIRAGGVGIIARQARVHIVNSTIGGSLASYEASEGAKIYVASSTFTGVGRRFDTAEMNDLGGNEYQLHR
jgi:uncharacterized Zn-binding protein involved in type VI secretion